MPQEGNIDRYVREATMKQPVFIPPKMVLKYQPKGKRGNSEAACLYTTKNGFKISTKRKKKFRKTSEMMKGFCFVILIISFNSPNIGMDDNFQNGSGDHSPPTSTEVKNGGAILPLTPICLHGVVFNL
jgi:hypothetical protein